MLRVQGGDADAFPELFRRLAPRVLQYVRRLVGSEARAEEVTQDVFIQVYRFRDRYQPQSRLATWVFTIATNLSLNELRRPERQLRVDLWDDERPEGPPLPDPEARTPEENASALELSRTLETAVPWGMLSGKVAKLFPVAILGLFATGAYMTHKFWTWSTPWIVVAIVVLVVLAVQGAGIAEHTAKKLQAAMRANGPGPLGPEARKMCLHPGLWVVEFANLGIVLAVVWNMTEKPGWGGSIASVLIAYMVGVGLAVLATRSAKEELAAAPEAG